MAKYISNRLQNLKIGIVSYTENKTVLEITGKVGIGTTNATRTLDVNGEIRLRGALYDKDNQGGTSGQLFKILLIRLSLVLESVKKVLVLEPPLRQSILLELALLQLQVEILLL